MPSDKLGKQKQQYLINTMMLHMVCSFKNVLYDSVNGKVKVLHLCAHFPTKSLESVGGQTKSMMWPEQHQTYGYSASLTAQSSDLCQYTV